MTHQTHAHRPSRRTMLAGTAAAAAMTTAGSMAAAPAAQATGTDPFDPGAYTASHGLRFESGFPAPVPSKRSIDFRVSTDQVKTFPPSFRVMLPEGYADTERTYPVLLLLHGGWGMFLDWTERGGNAVGATAGQDVIVVMPDGGGGSFYSNANFPRPGLEANWETFIIEQVLPFVHDSFRTDPSRMAIAGLSMGGFGALALGQKYDSSFLSVSAYSGPADVTAPGVDATIALAPLADAQNGYWQTTNPPGAVWGWPASDVRFQYDPLSNVERYRGKRLFLRCGDGLNPDLHKIIEAAPDIAAQLGLSIAKIQADVTEIGVKPTNVDFHDALDAAGIEHDFAVWPGHEHDWDTWNRAFEEDLPGIMAALRA
ncbi:esterase family protein [Brachybacterium halotolerans subsp. kimchii]|uniref:alpha/beta hydrolase n=1 Tax=Brachybacterium halotolerans TaxID=2795215 RepID=UPI001E28B6D8|nr:alpha/beta hydrolase family protein [Brachybacterium halotolerans]UEJ82068.1 esterase family protein [Brachybacterium halotolerans subsp. kimchii]